MTTNDYYALYGIFDSTRYAFPGSEERKRPADFPALLPRAEAEARRKVKQSVPVAYAASEGTGHNVRIHKRGEPRQLGDAAPRRFLDVLGGDTLPPREKGSGRLQLAQWLTRPSNPLTARVLVNRLWQHHFGRGLVATSNDFGSRGRRPTHPKLLDHLAHRFMASGWSIKAMHRLLLLSRTYQLSSEPDSRLAEADPANELHGRFDRQRLDAETIRDALLAVGGNLDRSRGGAHPFPAVGRWGFTQHNPFTAVYPSNRRSIYLMTQRLKRHPFLALFDGPDPNASTDRRLNTTVPTQALFLMNDPFVHEQSAGFARRILAARAEERARLEWAFEVALARTPTADETRESAGLSPALPATPRKGRTTAAAGVGGVCAHAAGPQRVSVRGLSLRRGLTMQLPLDLPTRRELLCRAAGGFGPSPWERCWPNRRRPPIPWPRRSRTTAPAPAASSSCT